MPPETFDRSLWHATGGSRVATPPLDGPVATDVAVVGGGILGVSTALHLALAGTGVVLVEAREIGWGASGRNGGLVVPHYARLGPADARAALGEDRGDRLSALLGGGAELVFDLVRRHRIACDPVQAGWLCPAHAPSRLAGLEGRLRQWQALGRDGLELLDAAATAAMTGIPGYHGALLDRTGGHLNPLAYVRGLARAAMAAGARIVQDTPVTGLRRDGDRWQLDTEGGGRISAGRVLLATNAGRGTPAPGIAAGVVPLHVYQSATAPLPPDMRGRALPGGQSLSDTRADLFSLRPAVGGRLVTGGMASLQLGALGRIQQRMAQRIERFVPGLAVGGFEHQWHGTASVTPDLLPRFWRVGPGALAVTACNGRGITLNTALGPVLAQHLSGAIDEAALPVPVTDPQPLRYPRLSAMAPGAMLLFAGLHDRLAR